MKPANNPVVFSGTMGHGPAGCHPMRSLESKRFLSSISAPWLLLCLACVLPCTAQDRSDRSNITSIEFKATLLAKISDYIKWPADTLRGTNIVIGLLASDPFDGLLHRLLEAQTSKVHRRSYDVRILTHAKEASDCQIVFVPESAEADWEQWQQDVKDSGVLAVGETREFLDKKGAIFLSGSDRKMEIHFSNAKLANVKIESTLLRAARKVYRD
jgi:YfiR/HmsC-like